MKKKSPLKGKSPGPRTPSLIQDLDVRQGHPGTICKGAHREAVLCSQEGD